jgi:DNA-binding GntR family transcriptional regulator
MSFQTSTRKTLGPILVSFSVSGKLGSFIRNAAGGIRDSDAAATRPTLRVQRCRGRRRIPFRIEGHHDLIASASEPAPPYFGAMTDLRPVDSPPVTVESLHDELRRQILMGELAPGAVLSQVKLADAFGTGRTPLREALRMLQREGLVDAEYNRRVRVAELSTSELDQIYACRVVLEAMAVRTTILRYEENDLLRLRELLAEMEAFMPNPTERLAEWEQSHSAFHRLLISRAGDRIVRDALELQDQSLRYRKIMGHEVPSLFAPGAAEHSALVIAAEQREVEEAGLLLAKHLARSGLALLSQVNPTYDAVALRQALRLVIRDPVPDALPG